MTYVVKRGNVDKFSVPSELDTQHTFRGCGPLYQSASSIHEF